MKINHELPLDLMHLSETYNDYEFVLPHLLDQHEAYKDYILKAKKRGRYIIMDNSLHELGEAYNFNRLKYWLHELKPNEFIVPDVWENPSETLAQAKYWKGYENVHKEELKETTFVSVVQATSFETCVLTYNSLKELGYEKICFSYGADWYSKVGNHPNKDIAKALGRVWVISEMIKMGFIEENDRVHLLGTSCPFEFAFHKHHKQIETIDTSNPVMIGIEGNIYNNSLTNPKPKANLNSHFDEVIGDWAEKNIRNNINIFRKFIEK